jgi:hypothetical protein
MTGGDLSNYSKFNIHQNSKGVSKCPCPWVPSSRQETALVNLVPRSITVKFGLKHTEKADVSCPSVYL